MEFRGKEMMAIINRFVEGLKSNLAAKNEYQQLYYHKLGTPSSQDKVILETNKKEICGRIRNGG
ncbi:MAG: hypothetical protein IPJ20_02900 [Flammeovirgaceae bacterium]|nr:hypothetical protein [Flammeovirgaceae bacterium]